MLEHHVSVASKHKGKNYVSSIACLGPSGNFQVTIKGYHLAPSIDCCYIRPVSILSADIVKEAKLTKIYVGHQNEIQVVQLQPGGLQVISPKTACSSVATFATSTPEQRLLKTEMPCRKN